MSRSVSQKAAEIVLEQDGQDPEKRKPEVIEGPGRYVVYRAPDGGWVVARAVDICDNCRGCGCGQQAEPIEIPGMVIAMAERGGVMGKLKGLMGRG